MPAELLLLLIVAFASPSCQVLSSLRMGEALQRPRWPCLLTHPPRALPGALSWACQPLRTQGSGPRPSSPRLLPPPDLGVRIPALSNLRSGSLEP